MIRNDYVITQFDYIMMPHYHVMTYLIICIMVLFNHIMKTFNCY